MRLGKIFSQKLFKSKFSPKIYVCKMKIKDSGIRNIQLYTCYFRHDFAHGEKDEVKAFPCYQ